MRERIDLRFPKSRYCGLLTETTLHCASVASKLTRGIITDLSSGFPEGTGELDESVLYPKRPLEVAFFFLNKSEKDTESVF